MIFGAGLAEKFELVVWRAAGGSKYGTESREHHQKTSAEVGEADAEAVDCTITARPAWMTQRGPMLTQRGRC